MVTGHFEQIETFGLALPCTAHPRIKGDTPAVTARALRHDVCQLGLAVNPAQVLVEGSEMLRAMASMAERLSDKPQYTRPILGNSLRHTAP